MHTVDETLSCPKRDSRIAAELTEGGNCLPLKRIIQNRLSLTKQAQHKLARSIDQHGQCVLVLKSVGTIYIWAALDQLSKVLPSEDFPGSLAVGSSN